MGEAGPARVLDVTFPHPESAHRDPILARLEQAENFPVALRILPATLRKHLVTVYDVARVIDDTGDELAETAPGDRERRLLALREHLHRAWDDEPPAAGLVARLAETVRACHLQHEPFDRLIQANLQDQTVGRYAGFPDLVAYCALSADPIGRLVLAVFGASTPETVRLSDPACTALQILEHCQDVGEDYRQDRIYLPQEDLARFGVDEPDLAAPEASPRLRALVRFEAERAGDLLEASTPLVGLLHGWARVAVAGYLAGGLATRDAVRRASGGVLPEGPRPRKRDVLRHAGVLLVKADAVRTATMPERAYAACEEITKTEARNFYYGIRLLPQAKRTALCAVYALARRIDDIGDGDLPPSQKLAELDAVRAGLTALEDGDPDLSDPVFVAVGDAARRYQIPLGAFGELVDGVRMDVVGHEYRTFEELVLYCRCVAGSIGRLCLAVFDGSGTARDPRAVELADALGIGLQQINILRDIREDLINGRVYLPSDDLDRFGVKLQLDANGALEDPDDALAELIRYRAGMARDWYDRGLRLVPMLDRRSAACCAAMAGIYSRLLDRIAADPQLVYTQRLSLPGKEKAAVALKALTGRRV